MNPLWPHQTFAISEIQAKIKEGYKRILLTSPTGGGKTRVASELIAAWVQEGLKVALYTNRKMLVEQTSRFLAEHGIDHGVRAADFDDEEGRFYPVQVCSVQTEDRRSLKSKRWELFDAGRILIDESHLQKGDVGKKIIDRHIEEHNAAVVGLTATPIDLGDMYDTLIVAGTNSELRSGGALVAADHYGPDEPDMRAFKKLQAKLDQGENPSEAEIRKAMMTPTIWGRVWEWFEKLNPERKPTILFASGVNESIWFAEQFTKKGVRAAHIDGEHVWLDGELHRSDRELRKEVLDGSKGGNIKVVCNRFVLREGIDAPWLAHGILATIFGSLQSFLQSGGRLLRAYPGVEAVTIQDHGGNWHRHGSLNADREWNLEHTSSMLAGLHADRLRQKKVTEPIRCPRCSLILNFWKCRLCGYVIEPEKKSRPVVSTDGSLKYMDGDIYRPRRISRAKDGPKLWEQMYYRSLTDKGDRTFRAAAALFAYENNWQFPDLQWPFMPIEELDFYRHVRDVPRERLRI